jgi:heme exporter protein D
MMPDLGRYAEAVLSSYAVSLVLLVLLAVISIRRARRVKRDLDAYEAKMRRDRG